MDRLAEEGVVFNTMAEDLLRELDRLERGIRVSVNVAVDDDGYLDRCAAAAASTSKILAED